MIDSKLITLLMVNELHSFTQAAKKLSLTPVSYTHLFREESHKTAPKKADAIGQGIHQKRMGGGGYCFSPEDTADSQ